ncbi:amino-acid N-acetyltransferase [Desulfomarina sp.]
MNSYNDNFLKWFRHVSPYIHLHRGKTFVIMIPGDCIDQQNFPNIIWDIATLHSLGIRLVIVHGARIQIEKELLRENIHSRFHKGSRITERSHLEPVLRAVGATRFQLEALFSSGLPDSPMSGAKIKLRSGNFITAKPQGVINGIDHQMTGKVRSVDTEAILDIVQGGGLPLLSPLGYSVTGEVFNLSFADVGISVAAAIQADKILIFNDDGPIHDKKNSLYRQLTIEQCRTFLRDQQDHAPASSYFSLRACLAACRRGVPRAHIISSMEDGTLLKELFTRDGNGTMVYGDHYESIRAAEANDVVGIMNLISPLEKKGILVKRSRELLENEIDYFTVMEKDNMIIGCAALYPIDNAAAGELACVAVLKEYQKDGRAKQLLDHIEKKAKQHGMKQIFALTTRTAHWFLEQGFMETSLDMMPASRKKLYNYQRNSKIFIKTLQDAVQV